MRANSGEATGDQYRCANSQTTPCHQAGRDGSAAYTKRQSLYRNHLRY